MSTRTVILKTTLLALTLCATSTWAQADTADLSGVGTSLSPRVMVIIDNSRSMEALPTDDYDFSYRDDVLSNSIMVDQGSGNYLCDPANATVQANCRNKFCVGQCVLHNVFDPFDGILEFGFATYFQYYRKVVSEVTPISVSTTSCLYDVLAGPNEDTSASAGAGADYSTSRKWFWSKQTNLATAGQCTISNRLTAANVHSIFGATSATSNGYGSRAFATNEFGCAPLATPATTEPAKTCTALTTTVDQVFTDTSFPTYSRSSTSEANTDRALFTHKRYSNVMPSGAIITPKPYLNERCNTAIGSGCNVIAGTPPTTGNLPSTGATSFVFPASLPSYNANTNYDYSATDPTVNDGKTWYLYRTTSFPDPASSTFVNSDLDYFRTVAPTATNVCPAVGATDIFSPDPTNPASGVRYTTSATTWYTGNAWTHFNNRCNSANPCKLTMVDSPTPANTTQIYFMLPTTPPAGGTLVTGSPFPSGTVSTTASTTNPGSCPARSNETALAGCSAGNPCDLLAGTVVTNTNAGSDTSKYTYDSAGTSYSSGGNTYNTTGTTSTATVNPTAWDPTNFPSAGRPGSSITAVCPATLTPNTAASGCNTAGNHLGSRCTLTLNVAASSVAGDPPMVQCRYTRTQYNLAAYWNTYQCNYNRREWRYTVPGPRFCRWKVTEYEWRVDARKYRWASAGGEVVATTSISAGGASPGTNYCSSASQPPLCPNVLDNTLATTPATCKLPGRQCRLSWKAAAGSTAPLNVAKGRKANAVVLVSNSNNDLYCRTADYQYTAGGITPAINTDATSFVTPSAILNQWCSGSTGTAADVRTDNLIMGDPYSPVLNPSNTGIPYAVGSSYLRGSSVQSVQYSMDRSTWVDAPMSNMLPIKNAGWSRLANGTVLMSATDPTIPLFRAFGSGTTVPQLRQSILNLSMASRDVPAYAATSTASCKDGVKNGTETDVDCGGSCSACVYVTPTGHSTPLYGSLKNFHDYLTSEITDSNAQCRGYAVVLLTDGQENQLPSQPQHPSQVGFDDYGTSGSSTDLVNVVTQIKNAQVQSGSGPITPIGGVKTYVVGFGNAAAGGALDAMAVAAGTDVGGVAYNATNPTNLKNTLNLIFNNIAQNRYTRSKPVLTRDGTSRMLYSASFDILGNAREWQGYLDAFDTTTIGPTGSPPTDWQFSQKLNDASPSSRRLFTWLNNDPTRKVNLHNMPGITGADSTQLVNDMTVADKTTADAVINFVMNPSKSAAFNGTPLAFKASRLSDIYHSAPAVIGPPAADNTWPNQTSETSGYVAYKTANAARPSRLFIGSNTGMVHAICERTGTNPPDCGSAGVNERGVEVYAFTPPALLPKLKQTPNSHAFTADGSFGGADLCLAADCTIGTNWKTVLLGSLYRGGNSLFAMDITNADNITYMFKLSAASLGESWSAPVVGRAQVSVSSGPTNRWIALAGGGYWTPTGPLPVGNISNSFMVFDMHTAGAGGGILQDNNATVADRPAEFRVDFNAPICDTTAVVDPTCMLPRNSVPGRVAVLRDGKTATIKTAFFGDTQGRMWVSDLTTPVVKNWQPKVLFDPSQSACAADIYGTPGGTPIYDATDVSSTPTAVANLPFSSVSTPRPIFQRVTVSVDADNHTTVYAGTGNVLDPLYSGSNPADPKQYDYFYAVRYNDGVAGTCYGSASWMRRFRHNEKMLSEATIGGSVVFVATFMPPSGSSVCAERGDGRIYAFYTATGLPAPVFDDLTDPANPGARTSVLDIPNSGIISDLYFMPDGGNRNKGTVGFVDSAGKPAQRGITGIATGAKVKSFKRVR